MSTISFTHQDYVALSQEQDLELIEGELVVSPSPSWQHQTVAAAIARELGRALRGRGRVAHEVDVQFSGSTVRPDVIFISNQRLQIVRDGEVHGAPDLVVEVLSPLTAERDRVAKRRLYEANRVAEYWLVSPEAQSVQVITFKPASDRVFVGADRLHSPRLDIEISLGDLFE